MQAGVSTYLALTFGTLLSSQGTDASFGPVSPGPSGRFPSCFSVLLSCVSDSIRLFRVRFPVEAGPAILLVSLSRSSLSRFPFPAAPTLPDSFSFRFRSEFDFWWPVEWPCLSADSTLSETLGAQRTARRRFHKGESCGSAEWK
ncbi:hypothetical protein B1H20_12215 [Streptomyces violaceoruber]|uniref:Uncharacterized protein n=1 Tax=Streptomyces violaceoruber TaxID=1935 RepID=A0A1V0UAD3_STRVN|nr:hypothetical protein B1H20_12215 [Streptomyces violaceoruber]